MRGLNFSRSMKVSIAIVDDDEAILRALRRLLRACGLQADTFASGRAFLDALPRQVPDCVLLDVQMPGLDGWEVQAKLATSGWRVPVIFITAHQDAAAQERAMSTGAVAFLSKPFRLSGILRGIQL
jgi:FixJ family two-component response regulator